MSLLIVIVLILGAFAMPPLLIVIPLALLFYILDSLRRKRRS
jgi:hypothetical protein